MGTFELVEAVPSIPLKVDIRLSPRYRGYRLTALKAV